MSKNLSSVLSDVFERNAEARFDTIEAEHAAILAARDGNDDAVVSIIYAYGFALSNAVAQYRRAGGAATDPARAPHMDEELRSAALFGLMTAIHAFDPAIHRRLAAIVNAHLMDSLSTSLIGPVSISVPSRTLKRFYFILREAKGDVLTASTLAPQYEMKVETFLNVLSAVRAVEPELSGTEEDADDTLDRLEGAMPIWTVRDEHASVEDRIDVEAAFKAVDTLEEDVVRHSYGFEDFGEPASDMEVGHRLGLSRPKVQRVRTSALGKMRVALGVA